jgi:hypothetical protein
MTDTKPRDLIKLLIDALKEECNWIDNPKHDELIVKATAYLTQYVPEISTDEGLNSKSSPNNLQIRSFDITPPPELEKQWFAAWESGDNEELSFADFVIPRAAQWGADQELEACCEWLGQKVLLQHQSDVVPALLAARRPQPPSLKEQAFEELDGIAAVFRMYHGGDLVCDTIRRALEQLDD